MSVIIEVKTTLKVHTDEEINVKEMKIGSPIPGIEGCGQDPCYNYCWVSCYVPERQERDLIHDPCFHPTQLDVSSVKAKFGEVEIVGLGVLNSGPYYIIPAKGPRTFTEDEIKDHRYYKGIFGIRYK